MDSFFALERRSEVRQALADDLLERHDVLASPAMVPHPDRIVTLTAAEKTQLTPDVLHLVLAPAAAGACFCAFVPGQKIDLWRLGSALLSRSFSIANAPHRDERIELHLRRVGGGRFIGWLLAQ